MEETIIQEDLYKGYKIKITKSYIAFLENPLKGFEDYFGGIFYCNLPRGDYKHFMDELKEQFSSTRFKNFDRFLKKKFAYAQPIYFFDHDIINLSLTNDEAPFNDRWDAGLYGIMTVPKDIEVDKSFLKKLLEESVYDFNQMENGDIYDISICDKYDTVLDSIDMWYGNDFEAMKKEARSIIDL